MTRIIFASRRHLLLVATIATGILALAVVAIAGYDSWLDHHPDPAPPMTDDARAAGAVRLVLGPRGTPPPVETVTVEGEQVRLSLVNVAGSDADPTAAIVVWASEGVSMGTRVDITRDSPAYIENLAIGLVDAYPRRRFQDEAADIVVTESQ